MRRAFTLVELLVVVAIISLLIAILLPALNKAKYMARSTVCLTNDRQIGMAMQMYLNDSTNLLPHAHDYAADPDTTWVGALRDYDIRGKVLLCPNATVATGSWHYSTNPPAMREHRGGDPAQVKYDQVWRFSQVVALFDGAQQARTNGVAQDQGKLDRYSNGNVAPWGVWYSATAIDNGDLVEIGPNTDFWTGNDSPKGYARWRETGTVGDASSSMINLLFFDWHAESRIYGNLIKAELRPGVP